MTGSWACDAKQWQDSGGVAGVAAQRDGDVAVARTRTMPMARLCRLGTALGNAGADLQGVLGEGDIAEVVQRLDAPVAPDPGGQAGGLAWAAVRLVTT
jgi:hypothetical protein